MDLRFSKQGLVKQKIDKNKLRKLIFCLATWSVVFNLLLGMVKKLCHERLPISNWPQKNECLFWLNFTCGFYGGCFFM